MHTFLSSRLCLAQRSANLTFKVLWNTSWLLLIDLCVSPLLSNHTIPGRFPIMASLAIPETVPEIWVANVSLVLFLLLFTHFTTFRRSLLESSHYSLEPLASSLLCFGNLDLFSRRDSWHVFRRRCDILMMSMNKPFWAPLPGLASPPLLHLKQWK